MKAGKSEWTWRLPKCERCWDVSSAGKVLVDSERVFLSALEYFNVSNGYSWNRLIYCLNLSSGEVLWVRKVYNNYLADTELMVREGRLYVTSGQWIYCFNYDGELLWKRSNGFFCRF